MQPLRLHLPRGSESTEIARIAHSLVIFTAHEVSQGISAMGILFRYCDRIESSPFARHFRSQGNGASQGLKRIAIFRGSVKLAAATAEVRAILVPSVEVLARVRKCEKAVAVCGMLLGVPHENSLTIARKIQEIFSNRKVLYLNSWISGTERGKPAANLGSTLPFTLS